MRGLFKVLPSTRSYSGLAALLVALSILACSVASLSPSAHHHSDYASHSEAPCFLCAFASGQVENSVPSSKSPVLYTQFSFLLGQESENFSPRPELHSFSERAPPYFSRS